MNLTKQSAERTADILSHLIAIRNIMTAIAEIKVRMHT